MTPIEAIRSAAGRLSGETARLDAELLVASLLGLSREDVLLGGGGRIDEAALEKLVARRAGGEPIAYILKRQEFWSLVFKVTPDVLIPRPETELLLEHASKVFPEHQSLRILDLGTGSGALAIAALTIWPQAEAVATDISSSALMIARENARRHGVADRLGTLQSDWFSMIEGQFDLILANPPYVEIGAELPVSVRDYEPHAALYAGADGLDDYRRIIPQIPDFLAANGRAFLEVGHDQSDAVRALARAEGLCVAAHADLAGLPRVIALHGAFHRK